MYGSATETQPVAGGRRRFVPPTKGGEKSNNPRSNSSRQSGGFHPGRSVMQHMVKNTNNQ